MTTLVYLGLAALLASSSAHAAVSLSGTRLIFDGRFPEASLQVVNGSEHEVLIQSWLSDPANIDGSLEGAAVELPFVLSPQLAHLEARGKQTLRVLYQGQGMPLTGESLLHLYVLEIPRRTEVTHALSIAIRQRINVFYRPAGLADDPATTASRLSWTLASTSLSVSNPTSYHAALQDVRLGEVAVSDYLLLAPGASHEMPVPAARGIRNLSFKALNDYGGADAYCAAGKSDGFDNTEHRQKDC
ncbi:fimbrial biogenesis chaperone [Pseudomonas viridiflava]|uniref:fimbrial biogenesis chaperone n=1 Tax=Pseudomonas viridiflava TaxID=33069 RepID=UPI000F0519D1|nr:molecular chaperone [Pseudomonas viridiflava]